MSSKLIPSDRVVCNYDFESYKRHTYLRPTSANASSFELVDTHCWPPSIATEGFPSKIVVPVRKYEFIDQLKLTFCT